MKRFTSFLSNKFLIKTIALLFWLLVWELAARYVGREIILASPSAAFMRLLELSGTAYFWSAVGATMLRVLEGFFHAVWVGTVLAVITHKFTFLKYLFQPFLNIVRATPVASLIILALFWMLIPRIPVFIVFLMILPIIWTNIFAGLEVIDRQILEMGGVFNFGWRKKIRYIFLPSLMPYISSALITGLGAAWKTAIGAEVLTRPMGTMGWNIYTARIFLLTADVFAWTIAVIVLSVLLEKLIAFFLNLTTHALSGKWGNIS